MAQSTDQRTRNLITAVMDIALVLALVLLARLLVGFFSVAAITPLGSWYLRVTSPLALPLAGDWAVRSPYGGVFSVDTGIVIIVLLLIEWALAATRRHLAEPQGGDE